MINLKFKAYVKPINKIVDVKVIDFNRKMLYFYGERFTEIEWFLDDCILLPFTGCLNNNGKEVYYMDVYRRWWFPDYKDYTIEYEGGGFFLGDDLLIDVRWEDYEYQENKFILENKKCHFCDNKAKRNSKSEYPMCQNCEDDCNV